MKSLLKNAIVYCIVISAHINIGAQTVADNPIVRTALDEMFEDLDKEKVPTGYLLDYAMDIVDMNRFAGNELAEDNYVSASLFADILATVKSASVQTCPIGDINELMSDFKFASEENVVNVGLLLYKYNYIKENALQDNLINYVSGRVLDNYVDGEWQNPYDEEYVFAFTPSSNISLERNIIYKFSTNFAFLNNLGVNMQFDAGDGNGYRNINFLSSIPVTYSTPGFKELRLKLTVYGGIVLEAHSSMYVVSEGAGNPSLQSGETPSTPPSLIEYQYINQDIGAQISTYYANGNTRLTRPFIVVEGFDPWELLRCFGTNIVDHLGSTHHEEFYNERWTLKDQYDLIYIDWFNSTGDILDNALLLEDIIVNINGRKVLDGCEERSVIMGSSMGGLIARIALIMMEDSNRSHGISTYISHDSPHLGANVPLGVLYFVHQALCFLNGFENTVRLVDFVNENDVIRTINEIWRTAHSPAARQMMVNYVNKSGVLDNSEHATFQSWLNRIGFPEGDFGWPLEKLAIANGYINNQSDIFSVLRGQHYFVLDGSMKTSYLADLLFPGLGVHSNVDFNIGFSWTDGITWDPQYPGSNKFEMHAEINPLLSHSGLVSQLRVKYTKNFSWTESESYYIFNESAFSPSTGLLYDAFPGSKYSTGNTLMFRTDTLDNFLYTGNVKYGVTDRIMFIPTASALGMFDESVENYNRNYFVNPPIPGEECPFDAYALADNLTDHMHIGIAEYQWISKQINMKIAGPSYVSSGHQFSVEGYSGPIVWNSSNPSAAVITASGKLTATGGGITTITAEYYDNGKFYRKSKEVVVNFPDIVISSYYAAGNGYTFTAKSSKESVSELLTELVADGVLQYEWTTLDSEGNRNTEISSSNTITYLPDQDDVLTVSVRLVDTHGQKGTLKSVSFNLRTPMTMNYEYVVVDSQQNVYFIKDDNTYEVGMPSDDFIANFRLIPMNETDSILSDQLRQRYLKGRDCYISYPYGLRMTGYMQGVPFNGYLSWRFDFFERDMFLDELEEALLEAGGNESFMKDFYLTLCNSEEEPLQDIPFVIIYKPVFPEN